MTVLSNGNYVVLSPGWNNGCRGNHLGGSHQLASPAQSRLTNSLVGSQANDLVGWGYVTALSNGNYVVSSHYWNNGTIADAGAVTWGDGTSGVTGTVTVTNSLVGSRPVTRLARGRDCAEQWQLCGAAVPTGNTASSSTPVRSPWGMEPAA